MIVILMIIALLAFAWCMVFCLRHFLWLVKLGKVKDLSQKSGNVAKAVVYSNTAAMLPNKKESAYKHLPTYTAGIIFHLGSFLSLLLFVFSTFVTISLLTEGRINVECFFEDRRKFTYVACFLLPCFLCGLFLFFKRLFFKKIRPISNFDDYFSTGIVVLFQFFSFLLCIILSGFDILLSSPIFVISVLYGYYITASLLFLYLPFGKLKHVVYFFAARYHLGFFYGWRNTWPPKKVSG